jgi:hypothetical protein|tara:strand:- start:99 stop:206 length:108 start_codon:yes stop_codon:yes gene_type:complete
MSEVKDIKRLAQAINNLDKILEEEDEQAAKKSIEI